MKPNASQLAVRYLPFLAVAAILCLLVVITPSKGPGQGVTAGDFSGEGGSGDFSGESGDGEVQFDAEGNPIPGTEDGSDGSGSSGSGSSGGGSGGSGGEVAAGGGSGGVGVGCEGLHKGGPYPLDVRCRPKFSGDNGGATHNGITATEIRYTWYNPPSNPVVDGILAGAGYARETPKFCDTMLAYEKSVQKWYEMSGRKLVAVEGTGNNAGSRGCGGKYKFWQSTCNNNAPDPQCARAEARTIAQTLKVAFVLNPRGSAVLHEEFARYKIFDIGYGGDRVRFQQFAPFLWGGNGSFGMERLAQLHSEYYCKRLVGRGPEYAGDDVKALYPERQVGLIYPENGDGALKSTVDIWLKTVRGCGDTDAKAYSYQSNVERAQQQAANLVAQMRADKVTTVGFCCDPVSMLFVMQALEQNNYHPEHLVFPASSIASDVVGQLAGTFQVAEQWKHAFGISNYPINQPDKLSEFRKVYADGGGPGGMGGAAPIETESWGVFKVMMQMIHSAGPAITPRSVFDAMQDLPAVAPSKRTTGLDYAAPDPFTNARDVAEIWWNPNLRSYYNDQQGAMCYVNEGARYDIGKIPSGKPTLFNGNGACARLEEYE